MLGNLLSRAGKNETGDLGLPMFASKPACGEGH
jgi:hypothetical protein